MTTQPRSPLTNPHFLGALADCVADKFSSDAVNRELGIVGDAALRRGDLLGVRRALTQQSSTGALIELFLTGAAVEADRARDALAPLTLTEAATAGLITMDSAHPDHAPGIRAALDLRPYAESGGPDWWVLSDLGAEVRCAPLDAEHVLGVGSAALTLAQATVRTPVGRALDIGTGCGVQALHLSRHSAAIVATDISHRALSFAQANASLNKVNIDLRQGSLFEPVAGECFDLIVCNPPFVVGPATDATRGGFTYRDGGLESDSLCRTIVAGIASRLRPDGRASLLANWAITADQPWQERIAQWFGSAAVTAWVWQRETADPAEYVNLWLRDAGEQPGTQRWRLRYGQWMDWFAAQRVLAVGMGLISIQRTDTATHLMCEDVPQAIEQPSWTAIAGWFERERWLYRHSDEQLLAARLSPAADLVRTEHAQLVDGQWQPAMQHLRLSHGMRWEIESDIAIASLVTAYAQNLSARPIVSVLAAATGVAETELSAELAPILRDLVQRGLLLPTDEPS